jgi:sulfate permease, SulP family
MLGGAAAILGRLIPATQWLAGYRRADFRRDLLAGLTVGPMLVPQGMAYALLAGLPAVSGLYASIVGPVFYALFGTSRHLAIGPIATDSLLVRASLSPILTPHAPDYILAAGLLALLTGLIQLALGLLRGGALSHFLSTAVIGGFTTGAAVVIIATQLRALLGLRLAPANSVLGAVADVLSHANQTHLPTVAISVASLVVLMACRRRAPRFPAAMLLVLAGAAVVYLARLDLAGVQVVGAVPGGFPPLTVPPVSAPLLRTLLPRAAILAVIGYGESIAIAQNLAARAAYRIAPNRELVALGVCNASVGLLSGFNVTGSLSRSALTFTSGGVTPAASCWSAAVVLATACFLTPLFRYLPAAILAAIIVVAVTALMEPSRPRYLFRMAGAEGWTWIITFLVVVACNVQTGLLAGVAFSLLAFVWRSAHPHTVEVGWVEDEQGFRDLARYPRAETYPEGLILRIDSRLYFANMGFVEDRIREPLAHREGIQWVVLDMSGVNDMDTTALATLERLINDYGKQGVHFCLANMKGQVRELAEKAGWDTSGVCEIRRVTVMQALAHLGAQPPRSATDTPPAAPPS